MISLKIYVTKENKHKQTTSPQGFQQCVENDVKNNKHKYIRLTETLTRKLNKPQTKILTHKTR